MYKGEIVFQINSSNSCLQEEDQHLTPSSSYIHSQVKSLVTHGFSR